MTRTRHISTAIFCRHGLAPVELVLAIPLMLFVMALSVILGTAACWKIRASVVARNEIWSNRVPRNDAPADPWPAGWPQAANMNHSGRRALADLNFPAFQNRLIRGPLPNVAVNSRLLDATQAVRVGQSNVQRAPAMLAKMGAYQFTVQQPLIDGTWAYWQTGQWGNDSRRMPDLYPQTPPPNIPEKSAYDQSVQAILNAPFRSDLAVLDRDEELRAWFGGYRDFHPRMIGFCSLDPDFVRRNYIEDPRRGVLTGIARVPSQMTNTFLSMYRAQLQALKNAMPPPADAQAQIAALEQKIQMLEDYLSTLN